MMRASVFVGASVDGFIARPNGALDWLPAGGGEPHGYDEFIATVDTILIGRKTFETVLSFEAWPYGRKQVVILSSHGARHVYVDGGITIQRFLRANLIDRLVITRVPVLIGEGIPLFGSLPQDIRLRHVATRSYPSGLVQSEYEMGQA
jgi:dihydrofolate reductase